VAYRTIESCSRSTDLQFSTQSADFLPPVPFILTDPLTPMLSTGNPSPPRTHEGALKDSKASRTTPEHLGRSLRLTVQAARPAPREHITIVWFRYLVFGLVHQYIATSFPRILGTRRHCRLFPGGKIHGAYFPGAPQFTFCKSTSLSCDMIRKFPCERVSGNVVFFSAFSVWGLGLRSRLRLKQQANLACSDFACIVLYPCETTCRAQVASIEREVWK